MRLIGAGLLVGALVASAAFGHRGMEDEAHDRVPSRRGGAAVAAGNGGGAGPGIGGPVESGVASVPVEGRRPVPGDTGGIAPRGDHVDTLHGVRVPDPYRWMEDLDAAETLRWAESEDARARRFAAAVAERGAIRDEIARLADVRRYRPPSRRAGRYFYLSYQSSGGPGTPGTRLHVRDGPDSPERTLVDEGTLPDGIVPTRIVPGPDGRRVAYATAPAGSRWETVRVLDVETGRTLPDPL
ncbi:MAG: hypothetical protein ACOC8B_02160, partial [Gemmatimonadota bacterium]